MVWGEFHLDAIFAGFGMCKLLSRTLLAWVAKTPAGYLANLAITD
jgi:hypothetical protein